MISIEFKNNPKQLRGICCPTVVQDKYLITLGFLPFLDQVVQTTVKNPVFGTTLGQL